MTVSSRRPRSQRDGLGWRPVAAQRPAMSAPWWPWLASRDSLTARLIEASAGRAFHVRLVGQGVGVPTRDEALALGLPARRHAWIREVALCVDERPWVVARSVAPLDRTLKQRLLTLGERSLGSWLFRQPDLVRGGLEATPAQAPFGACPSRWGRRSIFHHGATTLLVQEFFTMAMADDLRLPTR